VIFAFVRGKTGDVVHTNKILTRFFLNWCLQRSRHESNGPMIKLLPDKKRFTL